MQALHCMLFSPRVITVVQCRVTLNLIRASLMHSIARTGMLRLKDSRVLMADLGPKVRTCGRQMMLVRA
jgi:hypothetical protein